MSEKTEIYDLLKVREYEQDGQQKAAFTRVGVAFPTEKGGFTLRIDEGIAVSGRVELVKRKPRESGEDPAA